MTGTLTRDCSGERIAKTSKQQGELQICICVDLNLNSDDSLKSTFGRDLQVNKREEFNLTKRKLMLYAKVERKSCEGYSLVTNLTFTLRISP